MLEDHLQKNKKRIQKIKETGYSQYIYQIELDKPNGHTMSNRLRLDGDITSIHRRENIDVFPRHFDINVVSMDFLCNFDGKLM